MAWIVDRIAGPVQMISAKAAQFGRLFLWLRVRAIVPTLQEYVVFNIDQCENLPPSVVTPADVKPRNNDERSATIDEFLAHTGANIQEGFGEAYYRPGADVISLPRFEAFKNAAHFYSTAFHELGHWTGHKLRLARDLRHRFGKSLRC
jgi:antirestriction protein ArdC